MKPARTGEQVGRARAAQGQGRALPRVAATGVDGQGGAAIEHIGPWHVPGRQDCKEGHGYDNAPREPAPCWHTRPAHRPAPSSRLAHPLAAVSFTPAQVFEVWMRQQSDLVQHTATAYAEREVLAACCRTLGAAGGVRGGGVSPALRALLEPVVTLYALHRLEQAGPCHAWGSRGQGEAFGACPRQVTPSCRSSRRSQPAAANERHACGGVGPAASPPGV